MTGVQTCALPIYIELICNIFNDYIENINKDLNSWNISIPEFFTEDKFRINTFLLKNTKTIDLLKSSCDFRLYPRQGTVWVNPPFQVTSMNT